MIWGVDGLRPNFFSSGRIFLAELAHRLTKLARRHAGRQADAVAVILQRYRHRHIVYCDNTRISSTVRAKIIGKWRSLGSRGGDFCSRTLFKKIMKYLQK